jgi:hypothetical protein
MDYELRLYPLVRRHADACEEWAAIVEMFGRTAAAEFWQEHGVAVPAVFAWYCFPALGVG